MARNITATATHVKIKYFSPLYAYTPTSFPYLLISFVALDWMTVIMIEATSRARKLMVARPQLPNEIRRDPCRNKATRDARIAHPAAAIPMA